MHLAQEIGCRGEARTSRPVPLPRAIENLVTFAISSYFGGVSYQETVEAAQLT